MFKLTPSVYHASKLLNFLYDDPQRKVFSLRGSQHWMHALAILIKEEKTDLNEFYKNVERKNVSDVHVREILKSILMALDFLNTLIILNNEKNENNYIRVAIITWYYGIYNAAQSMIKTCNTTASPQTHAETAKLWHECFIVPNLVPSPFNYRLDGLIEKNYQIAIAQFPNYDKYENSKPNNITAAQGMCCSYLKGTAKWYTESIYNYTIKNLQDFKKLGKNDFRTKAAQRIRDEFLKRKNISFLHQAYRYRGKCNYRDADFIVFSHESPQDNSVFLSDLYCVLQEFINMTLTYCKKRIGDDKINLLIHDIINYSSFSENLNFFLQGNDKHPWLR